MMRLQGLQGVRRGNVSTWQGWVYVAFVVEVFRVHRGLAPDQFDAHRVRARCA
jgi:hypothetical protein